MTYVIFFVHSAGRFERGTLYTIMMKIEKSGKTKLLAWDNQTNKQSCGVEIDMVPPAITKDQKRVQAR